MDRIFDATTHVFDPLHRFWERDTTERAVAGLLVVFFLLSLGAIELNRQGMLPSALAAQLPVSHYLAINLAFTFVLIMEVVSLIFTLPCSISKALGKQFEILALIFIRNSFKELSLLPEPISIVGQIDVFWRILADGGGSIAIFALLGLYLRLQGGPAKSLKSGVALYRFIASKKIVAFALLIIFFVMGLYNVWLLVSGQGLFHFFQNFYTVLIFSDILLVLIAQCFQPGFRAVFRNSGYALATLMIRLALTAPPFYNVLIGTTSVVFALLLTLIYDQFYAGRKT